MPKLLHIACSPRGDFGVGRGGAGVPRAFPRGAAELRRSMRSISGGRACPKSIRTMLDAKDAVHAPARAFTDPQQEAWAVIERMAVRFVARRPAADLDADVEFRAAVQAQALHRPHQPAAADLPLRARARLHSAAEGSADGGDRREQRRFRHRHESRPHRHGDALLARGAAFHGRTQVEFVRIGPTAGPREDVQAAQEAALRRLREIAFRF